MALVGISLDAWSSRGTRHLARLNNRPSRGHVVSSRPTTVWFNLTVKRLQNGSECMLSVKHHSCSSASTCHVESGLATLRFSTRPVTGSCISCQLIGTMGVSLPLCACRAPGVGAGKAYTTPRWLADVARK